MQRIFAIIFLMFSVSLNVYSQNFSLGDFLNPSKLEFELIGISSRTGVSAYRYKKQVNDRFYGRVLGDIIIGVKDEHIAQTIYLMIPEKSDLGVPLDIVNKIQSFLPFPLSKIGNGYGIKIDNYNITLTRTNDAMTFYKDRIMYFSSIKHSILEK
jgi:hypothetical protein